MSLEKKPLDNSATISSAARTLQPLTTSRPNHPNLFSSFHALSRLSLRLPLARRYYKLLSALTILLIVGYVGWSWKGDSTPPTYKSWRKRERNLPQHDVGLPFPQGKEGRYIYMANHVINVGWGNAMQEQLMNAHLAYFVNRTYVFDDYTWERDKTFSTYNGHPIPATIPMTALVSGPLGGSPFTGGSPSVSKAFFETVCPEKTIVRSSDLEEQLHDQSALTIVEAWAEKIRAIEDRCVEVEITGFQIFNFYLFGSDRHLLPIWPSYSQSPILTEFRWSPLITKAIARNRDLIHPDIAPPPSARFRVPSRLSFLSGLQLESELSDIAPLKGLLALHIRRGDYEEHCKNLAAWSSKYQGFDSFPEFLDHFDPEHDFDPDTDPSNRTSIYLSHCYPSILQIISRVRTIRHEYEHSPSHPGRKLDRIYILTNGKGEWLDDLERGLADLGGWTGIRTSRDLGKKLNKEERGVGQAVDMAIAQRADVFVGNGFSSLTSNVNTLRLARQGARPETIRLW